MVRLLLCSGLALLLSRSVAVAQSPANRALAHGTCSVAHSGNGDTIIIKNCGIGQQQAQKITELLKAVLAQSDHEREDVKLDELLRIAKSNSPYGSSVTYMPDGLRKTITPSLGRTDMNQSATVEFFQPLEQAADRGEWDTVESLARAAIRSYPGWFTPDLFLGEAQLHDCDATSAKASLNKFEQETLDAVVYQQARNRGQELLNFLGTDEYKTEFCRSRLNQNVHGK